MESRCTSSHMLLPQQRGWQWCCTYSLEPVSPSRALLSTFHQRISASAAHPAAACMHVGQYCGLDAADMAPAHQPCERHLCWNFKPSTSNAYPVSKATMSSPTACPPMLQQAYTHSRLAHMQMGQEDASCCFAGQCSRPK